MCLCIKYVCKNCMVPLACLLHAVFKAWWTLEIVRARSPLRWHWVHFLTTHVFVFFPFLYSCTTLKTREAVKLHCDQNSLHRWPALLWGCVRVSLKMLEKFFAWQISVTFQWLHASKPVASSWLLRSCCILEGKPVLSMFNMFPWHSMTLPVYIEAYVDMHTFSIGDRGTDFFGYHAMFFHAYDFDGWRILARNLRIQHFALLTWLPACWLGFMSPCNTSHRGNPSFFSLIQAQMVHWNRAWNPGIAVLWSRLESTAGATHSFGANGASSTLRHVRAPVCTIWLLACHWRFEYVDSSLTVGLQRISVYQGYS